MKRLLISALLLFLVYSSSSQTKLSMKTKEYYNEFYAGGGILSAFYEKPFTYFHGTVGYLGNDKDGVFINPEFSLTFIKDYPNVIMPSLTFGKTINTIYSYMTLHPGLGVFAAIEGGVVFGPMANVKIAFHPSEITTIGLNPKLYLLLPYGVFFYSVSGYLGIRF